MQLISEDDPKLNHTSAKIDIVKLTNEKNEVLPESAYHVELDEENGDLIIRLYKGAETAKLLEVQFTSLGPYVKTAEEKEAIAKGKKWICGELNINGSTFKAKTIVISLRNLNVRSSTNQDYRHTLKVKVHANTLVNLQDKAQS